MPSPEMGFRIQVKPSGLTAPQSEMVAAASDRCSRVIVGGPASLPAAAVLQIQVRPTSLPLGRNAATELLAHWAGSPLPCQAAIWLQKKAVAALEADGSLTAIVAHEIFHCLGFGYSWPGFPQLIRKSPIEGLVFCGERAVAEYKRLLKAGKDQNVSGVPVEMGGGDDQAGIHWRESVFGDELMTAKQGLGGQTYLSSVSIASLADMGYDVELSEADDYSL